MNLRMAVASLLNAVHHEEIRVKMQSAANVQLKITAFEIQLSGLTFRNPDSEWEQRIQYMS